MTANPDTSVLALASGVWNADPNHSGVFFRIRHLGLANVRGRFDQFEAVLTVGETLDEVSVKATIDLASVDTNQADRDTHLRGTDFFSVEKHQDMVFESTSVRQVADDRYELKGNLTIVGITHEVPLDVRYEGTEVFPADGSTRAGFSATGEINRDDFGIDFNMPLGMGRVALSQKVLIELDFQFVAP